MKYHYLFLSLCLLILSNCAIAQKSKDSSNYITKKTAKGKALKYYKKGMDYNLKENNEKAISEFAKALKAEPRFIDAQIQWAAINYYIKNYKDAEIGFEKALAIDPLYSKKVAYVLGLAEIELGKDQEGIQHLQQYIDSKPKNKTLLAKAERELSKVTFSREAMANPVPFSPQNLGDKINTKNPEYLPALTADQKTLIYTKRIRGQEDFYMSQKVDDVWQEGAPIYSINTDDNEGAQSISADGKFLAFTKCNDRKSGYGSCDIYFSELKDGEFTAAKNIGNIINTTNWESQPSLSADGKSIYFASRRKSGKGKSDIYVSHRDKNGKWSTPTILSDVINTEGDDQSPFIHADGQTLYFMSDGHPGMGGFDLYYSRKQKDGSWGKPTNLGYPINTASDESTLIVSLDGETAYFASDRALNPDGSTNKNRFGWGMDIYSFELYKEARPQLATYVRARIIDADTKKKIQANVEIIDSETNQVFTTSTTDRDGEFLITLPVGKNYALNVSKKNYTFHSEYFALAAKNNSREPYELQIELIPIKEKIASTDKPTPIYKPTVLHNVFFDTGSASLRSTSFTELDRLKTFLEENPSIKIQINGHTDNVGSDSNNLQLSENRAKAVKDYLINKGIQTERITYKGFGETKPIDTNDTDNGRQNNRRTEFEILQ